MYSTQYDWTKASTLVGLTYKNIESHKAHTIVSWPNPKQWVIVHTFDLIMIIRQSMFILSIITKEMGKLNIHSPTYCIIDNWENMLNLTLMLPLTNSASLWNASAVCMLMCIIWRSWGYGQSNIWDCIVSSTVVCVSLCGIIYFIIFAWLLHVRCWGSRLWAIITENK